MTTISTRKVLLYPNASWYFALAVLVTWLGFSFSYFARLKQNDIFHHLHGASAGAWMALLIIQPILYQRGQLAAHRRLGRIGSIVLIPALLIGGVKMMHSMMANSAAYPPGATYQLAFIDLISLFLFPLFFGLSIWSSRQIQLHARYMACTVLVILPPAITRLLFFFPWFDSFAKTLNGSFVAIELVLLLLLLDDKRSGGIRKPYLIALLLFGFLHVTMNFAGGWSWWQELMDQFSNLPL